jgi:drug/metabolite transporter (DMT)-like permease
MGAVLGLVAALLWGVGDLLARFAGRAIGPLRTLFYAELAGAIVLTGWLLTETSGGIGLSSLSLPLLGVGILAGLLHLLGSYALTAALTVGTISLVMPIASGYGAVSAALAILAGEPVTTLSLAGIIVTVLGVALAGAGKAETSGSDVGAGIGWAMVAALGFGFGFWMQGAFLIPVIGSLPSVWLFLVIGIITMSGAALTGLVGSLAFPPRDAILVTFGSGSLAIAAYVAVALGFALGQIAIVAVLSTLSSVVTAILGYVVLGERLAPRQLVGVALIIIGIVIINIG